MDGWMDRSYVEPCINTYIQTFIYVYVYMYMYMYAL